MMMNETVAKVAIINRYSNSHLFVTLTATPFLHGFHVIDRARASGLLRNFFSIRLNK